MLLVVGVLLPVVLFAVAVVHRLSSQEQVASERRALRAAHHLAETVESEMDSTTRTLQALAVSEQLNQENLQPFYLEMQRAAQTQPTWLSIILLAPDGQHLFNTRRPFGTELPTAVERESVRRVIGTRQPVVGNLAQGDLGQNLGFPIRVPVVRNGELRYILTAVITPNALARVLEEQAPIEGEWTRTVVDDQGTVVARTRNPERFVGKPGTPSFLERTSQTPDGVYRDKTLDGEQVYVAFSQVKDSGWVVAVTVPVRAIQGPAKQAMWLVIGSGLALLLVSSAGAILLSRHISRSIASAASAAQALARGDRPQVSPSSIQEVLLLAESLDFAANLLAQREQQQGENLARIEAAREEAETANRLKDEFLAVLSHELRSPLNPILGWSKLLRTGKLDATKTAYALETIERNAKLQTQLIEDLLDVSRILQGKLILNQVPVNLSAIVAAALETVNLMAQAKSIEIQMTLDPTTGKVLGDPARLQQVVWNLLSNAVKFTPEKGYIDIQLKAVGSHAQIQISDTGQGISPEFLPYVFEYFRQADSTTTRKFGGLGLGLAIVRHLVELQGGTVQADSRGEGQGSIFTVTLPLLEDENPAEKDEKKGLRSISHDLPLKDVQVLLVDDERDTRDVIAFILEEAGAIATVVESAIAVLELLPQIKPDILVSDIGMPGMNGYQLIHQIRGLPPEQNGQIPAIALSAYAGEIDQQKARAAGFHQHISKPVEPETLVEAIASLLARNTNST